MRKLLTKKSFINKVIIVLTIMMLFNFAAPRRVEAGLMGDFGGTIADALQKFTAFLGDTAMTLVEYCFTGSWSFVVKDDQGEVKEGSTQWMDSGKIDLPYISLSPEEIFSNKIAALNINFLQSVDQTMNESSVKNENLTDPNNSNSGVTRISLTKLRDLISKWYVALRTLALVGLLSVLVYTGIRIILSSTAQDKAKYKERIIDWIVAVCLLFFLHYIMLFTITITDSITKMLSNNTGRIELRNGDRIATNNYATLDRINQMLQGTGLQLGAGPSYMFDSSAVPEDPSILGLINDLDGVTWTYNGSDYELKLGLGNLGDIIKGDKFFVEKLTKDGQDIRDSNGGDYAPTNLMNFARLYCDVKEKSESFAFLIIYIALVFYTIMFVFRYTKRLIYMAFLTLMAPLVALTYPIDKIKDGKAQAFDMWLKEYVFNALIQPFHLLIYTVLVGSAIELASTNLIYAVVAIGFIIPAENLLRKFFGFDKAGTLSQAGSFAAGAGVASMFNMLKRPPKIPGLGNGGDKGGKSSDSGDDKGKVNYYNDRAGSALDGLSGDRGRLGSGNDDNNDNEGDNPRLGQDNQDDQENLDDPNNPELDPATRESLYGLGGASAAAAGMGLNSGETNSQQPTYSELLDQGYTPKQAVDMLNNQNFPEPETPQQPQRPTQPEPVQPVEGRVPTQPSMAINTARAHASRRFTAQKGTKGKFKRRALAIGKTALKHGLIKPFGKGGMGRRIIKGAARLTAGAIGAGAMASVGLAAGIASGDLSKAMQYGALGATAGAMAGNNAVNAASNLADAGIRTAREFPQNVSNRMREIQDDYHASADTQEELDRYREDRRLSQKERAMNELRRQDKGQSLIKAGFAEKDANRIMKDVLPDYFDQNITNAKEIAAIESYRRDMMKNDNSLTEERAREQAMRDFRINRELKARGVSKRKDRIEEVKGRLVEGGVSEEEAAKQANQIIKNGDGIRDLIDNG